MPCKERGYHLQPVFAITGTLHFMPMRDWSKMTWIEVWMLSLRWTNTSIISLLLSTLESIGTTVIAYVGIVWVHVLSWWQVDCLLKATTRPTSLQLAFGSERLLLSSALDLGLTSRFPVSTLPPQQSRQRRKYHQHRSLKSEVSSWVVGRKENCPLTCTYYALTSSILPSQHSYLVSVPP